MGFTLLVGGFVVVVIIPVVISVVSSVVSSVVCTSVSFVDSSGALPGLSLSFAHAARDTSMIPAKSILISFVFMVFSPCFIKNSCKNLLLLFIL